MMNESSGELPEFTPPASWKPEEGATEGEAMVKWRLKDDGKICITEFEGESLGGGEVEEVEEQEDSYPSVESQMSEVMKGGA